MLRQLAIMDFNKRACKAQRSRPEILGEQHSFGPNARTAARSGFYSDAKLKLKAHRRVKEWVKYPIHSCAFLYYKINVS